MNTAGYDSKFATLYYPWIEVMDPLTRRPIDGAAVRPHGRRLGAHRQHPRRAQGARPTRSCSASTASAFQITHEEQGGLNQSGINCIRAFPGRGIRVWGARTLSSDPEWRYLNVRRLFNYISESIMEGTQWAVFEPNDERLWIRLRISVVELPHPHVARRRAVRRDARRGVLRQVRRRDQPARRHRRRPGRDRDRHLAGQAGRVRDLPHQPVHGGRRRGQLSRTPRRERSTADAIASSHDRITLPPRPRRARGRGHVPRVHRSRLRDHASSSSTRSTTTAARRSGAVPGATEVVEHHPQARRRREPRRVEVAPDGDPGGARQRPHRRQHRADRLHRHRRSPPGSSTRAGRSSTPARRSTPPATRSPSRRSRSATRAWSGCDGGGRPTTHAHRVRVHAAPRLRRRRRGTCTATASCASRRPATRSSRCATRRCARTRPT